MSDLVLDSVTVAFDDVVAVDDVSLRVESGELLVLVGPSGCGKTTLLRTIAGLETPTAGEVAIDGRRVTDLSPRRRDVSLVFQDFALFPHLTVSENVSFDLRMQGADDVDSRVASVTDLLDIDPLLDRSIDELSGGQKQRVALGRALVTEPAVFLLDEPLANLDANLRERMQTEIARLQDDLGVTTVHVTHDQAEALTMGDRIAVMRDGCLEQVGRPDEVYHRPASLFVARFVGSPTMNLVDGQLDPTEGVFEAAGESELSLSVDDGGTGDGDPTDVVLGVRPEHLVVDPADEAAPGQVEATVTFEEFRGADRFLYLDAPGLPELVGRVGSDPAVHSGLSTGESVAVTVPETNVHLFDAATGARIERSISPDVTVNAPIGGESE